MRKHRFLLRAVTFSFWAIVDCLTRCGSQLCPTVPIAAMNALGGVWNSNEISATLNHFDLNNLCNELLTFEFPFATLELAVERGPNIIRIIFLNSHEDVKKFSEIIQALLQKKSIIIVAFQTNFPNSGSLSEFILNFLELAPLKDRFYISARITNLITVWDVYYANEILSIHQVIGRRKSIGYDTLLSSSSRRNFLAPKIRVLAQRDDDYRIITDVRTIDGKVAFVGGVGVHLLWDLQELYNFSIVRVEGEGWITQVPNSTDLTGMARQIVDGEADLAISVSSIHCYRAAKLRFLPPVSYSKGMAFYRQPAFGSPKSMLFLPFEVEVWISLFAIWFLLFLAVLQTTNHNSSSINLMGVSNAAVLAVGLICQQGQKAGSEARTARMVKLTAIFTGLLSYQYYTASFVATVSSPTQYITDLTKLRDFNYEIFINPSFPEFALGYTSTADEAEKLLAKSRELYRDFLSSFVTIASDSPRRAFLINHDGGVSIDLMRRIPRDDICRIRKVDVRHGQRVKDAMFMPKGSPYADYFASGTNLLVERGLNSRIWNSYRNEDYIHCLTLNTNDIVIINLSHVSIALAILLAGAAVSLCCLLFEVCSTHSKSTDHTKPYE